MTRLYRGVLLLAALVLSLVAAAAASARTQLEPARMTEVVVTLQVPPLASAAASGRDPKWGALSVPRWRNW